MQKIDATTFSKTVDRSSLWYALAKAWNNSGLRKQKTEGYLVARMFADDPLTVTVTHYRHLPAARGVMCARIDTERNKLKVFEGIR